MYNRTDQTLILLRLLFPVSEFEVSTFYVSFPHKPRIIYRARIIFRVAEILIQIGARGTRVHCTCHSGTTSGFIKKLTSSVTMISYMVINSLLCIEFLNVHVLFWASNENN